MSHSKKIILNTVLCPHAAAWLLALLLALSASVAALSLLMVSGGFIAASAWAGMVALGSQAFNYLMPSAIIRFLAMTRTAARYGELLWSHETVFAVLKNIRLRLFRSLVAQPVAIEPAYDSARQMHRLVSDLDTLDEFPLRVLLPYVQAGFLGEALAMIIAVKLPNGVWLGVFLWAVLLLPMMTSFLIQNLTAKQAELSEQRRRNLLNPLRMLTRLVLWQRWHDNLTAFADDESQLNSVQNRIHRSSQTLSLVAQWWLAVAWLVLLWQGGQALAQQKLDVIWLLAILLGVLGWQEWIVSLCQNVNAYGLSRAAEQRLNALSTSEKVVSDGIKTPLPQGNLTLSLNQLSAKTPNALFGANNISLNIESGKPCWIIGASGSGKSTLLHVLAQELPPLSGNLQLNQHPANEFDWSGQIGFLSQQVDIFAQTLAQNLRLGKANASDDELRAVLKKVALDEWFNGLPQGLNTPLGEYGASVSGGQARRIALARLLLQPKRLLLLDEPFAGLDADSREIVWQSVKSAQANDLLVIVSHQLWADMENEQIFVMKE